MSNPQPPQGPPPHPPQFYPPQPPPRKSHTTRNVLLGILGAFVLFVGGCTAIVAVAVSSADESAGDVKVKDQPSVGSSDTPAADDSASSTPEPPLGYHPKPKDFALQIKVTERDCFGSAGCNVSYRVSLGWAIPDPGLLDHAYDVTYRVTGGDMGNSLNTITLYKNGKYDVPSENFTSTSSENSQLKATVTTVSRSY